MDGPPGGNFLAADPITAVAIQCSEGAIVRKPSQFTIRRANQPLVKKTLKIHAGSLFCEAKSDGVDVFDGGFDRATTMADKGDNILSSPILITSIEHFPWWRRQGRRLIRSTKSSLPRFGKAAQYSDDLVTFWASGSFPCTRLRTRHEYVIYLLALKLLRLINSHLLQYLEVLSATSNSY